VALRHAAAADVLALVQAGAVDVGVTGSYASPGAAERVVAGVRGALPATVELEVLDEQPMLALLAPGDPLAAAGSLALPDLAARPLILAEPGSGLREAVMAACQEAGFSPVPLFEVSDPATVRHLVHAELGVSVVPASWLALPGPEVVSVTLAGAAPRHGAALLTAPAGRTAAGELLAAALRSEL
jgi:DNA-binding transcriptional LysR family regulator